MAAVPGRARAGTRPPPARPQGLFPAEVECIGKGKAHRLCEFGVKVSVATTVKHSAGGQFVTHVAALPGNPYDGHTCGFRRLRPGVPIERGRAVVAWNRKGATL